MDRNYVVHDIMGDLGVPRFTTIGRPSADRARLADALAGLQTEYAYRPDAAQATITSEMLALGAYLQDSVWHYGGAPVQLIFLIRTEDNRLQIGDYLATELEEIGFSVDRHYCTRAECLPIWRDSDPREGQWHLYTGGWVSTAVSRDDAWAFGYFYTPRGGDLPLWQAYTPTPEFDAVCEALWTNAFSTLDERRGLMLQGLDLSMQDSAHLWLVDTAGFSPYRAEVQVASDLAASIPGTPLWPWTLRRTGQVGGAMTVAQPGVLVDPWNPVAGSIWTYDAMPIAGTADHGVVADPYTGLNVPQRIQRAEVLVRQDLPMTSSASWMSLSTAPEIPVPANAWVDWDAAQQRFITRAQKYPDGLLADTRVRVFYPAGMLGRYRWHDGSRLSLADFVLQMILTFDRAKPDSALYDESYVPTYDAFMSHLKGVRIVSKEPLVIETYDDTWALEAERLVTETTYTAPGTTWFPTYGTGPGAWHALVPAMLAEAAGQLAFSSSKAGSLGVPWTDYLWGDSLPILQTWLAQARAVNYVPYPATLGTLIPPSQATERYTRLTAWFANRGNFWIGTGPFTVTQADRDAKVLTLARFASHPDPSARWATYAAAPVPNVKVTGPASVPIGGSAAFNVWAGFGGQPVPLADVTMARWLLYDAANAQVAGGDDAPVADGHWQVALGPAETGLLTPGVSRLEVVLVSRRVVIPASDQLEFVAVP